MPDSSIDLERFERHHPVDFERALAEIRAGHKRTHWMWFIFPQIRALGRSPMAVEYGIGSVDEAKAYLLHPILGRDYCTIVAAVWAQVVQGGVGLTELMGKPDDLKLVSSLTLFVAVARRLANPSWTTLVDQCDELLTLAGLRGFGPCTTTVAFLRP